MSRAGGRFVVARIAQQVALELAGDVIGQPCVPIAAAQLHVAVGGQRAQVARPQFDRGHVERAAAQIVDQHADGLAGLPMASR